MRTAALAVVVALLVLTGCTWSASEPALFREQAQAQDGSSSPPAPAPPNPRLPVAGESTWTSAEGQQVTARIAVHAVRRTVNMTVLDWSITPLSAPGRQRGDEVPPGFDSGLGRSVANGINIVLLDPARGRVYRPLSHVDRALYFRCLCTPLWAAERTLHLGETRLLQVAYPALPASVHQVDVFAFTVPVFSRVPVTMDGWAPTATTPVDLARPPERSSPLTAPQVLRTTTSEPPRTATLRVDEIIAGSRLTTVRWTLRSLTDQVTFALVPLTPPLAAEVPSDVGVLTRSAASGPLIAAPGRKPLSARWITGSQDGRTYLECLCSNFDFWALGLDKAGGSAQLVTVYPALPRGVDRVDVSLPGVANLPRLPVSAAGDGATRLGPPVRTPVPTWVYDDKDPLPGWSSDRWPTPVPEPGQRASYQGAVDRITALPR